MKRKTILVILAVILCLSTAASAAPVLTDGSTTAWIGEGNTLRLQTADGVVRLLDASVDDLLSMDRDALYLLDHSGRILMIRKDGSMGSVLLNMPTELEIEAWRETRFTLAGNMLVSGGSLLSQNAAAAACDSTWVYWVEKTDTGWQLRQAPYGTLTVPDGTTAILDGKTVPETLSMTATLNELTLILADRSVLSFDLKDGHSMTYAASGELTEAAAVENGELLRYVTTGKNMWAVESDNSRIIPLNTPEQPLVPADTPTPVITATPAPTPAPTATAAPTATPKPTATVTPDENIYKGERGSMVRRIQDRLDVLGYPVGKVDGAYGNDTQTALNLFMGAIHVTERNYVTPSVRKKLFAKDAPEYDPYRTLIKGDKGEAVRILQRRLQNLGYGPDKIDGKYGSDTEKAVKAFQEAAGLDVDGTTASRTMQKKLFSKDAPTLLVTVSGGVYKLAQKTASLIRPASKSVKTLTIPGSVTANGKTYTVISVGKGACKGLTSLKKLTIGANVRKIGDSAFSGCSKLEKIVVKSSKLTDEEMGSGVFTGVPKDAVVTCPSDMIKTYKKLFRDRGLPKQVEFNP